MTLHRRAFLKGLTGLFATSFGGDRALRSGPPLNMLLLTVDDMGGDGPGIYGNPVPGVTPHIDQLAREGLRFNAAHVTVSVCEPSRSVMMTGRYPHRSGAEGFEPINPDVPTLPEALAAAGYLTGIHGKVDHLQPVARYGWKDKVGGQDLGEGRDPARYGQHAAAFFARARRVGRPFFLMSNTHDPHRPFAGGPDDLVWAKHSNYPAPTLRVDPSQVPLPAYLPDLPEVRLELAEYYASVHRADQAVGAVLEALDTSGMAAQTLVVLLSDNGMSFPFSKATCYLAGTRVPWIVRWPGVVAPGTVDGEHLISAIDLAPTLLDAVGVPPLAGADGRPFTAILKGLPEPGFREVHTVFHETFAKRRLPTRCVQDLDWGYLYNAWPDGQIAFSAESERGRTFKAMVAAAGGDPAVAARVEHWRHRCREELYDLRGDPAELTNLAGAPQHAERLRLCREKMRVWMSLTADPLLPTYLSHIGPSPGATAAPSL